ncbi:MAG: hypothetical protein Q4D62_13125 [Planctomycetia bacterium]|nr:hypothetical protein [Planctomycetia bacterium]
MRSLDSERQTNVLEVLGKVLRNAMEGMGIERQRVGGGSPFCWGDGCVDVGEGFLLELVVSVYF